MAFRVNYQGAVIETDTAGEVQALLLALREPVPLLLGAGAGIVDELHEHTSPVMGERLAAAAASVRRNLRESAKPRGRKVAAPRPRKEVRSSAPASKVRTPAAPGDRGARILIELQSGPLKPAVLWSRLGCTPFGGRQAIAPLLADGSVTAQGATMSRVFSLGRRRAAKEGV